MLVLLVSYWARRQELKHFIAERAQVIEIELDWGATSITMVTLETESGVRLYQTYESAIAAPTAKSSVWVYYDPHDLETFSVHLSPHDSNLAWWMGAIILFTLLASAVLITGYLRSTRLH